MIMAGGPTDEVKQPVDPVRTDYRKGRGGSGHDVVRRSRHPLLFYFVFVFFWFQDHRDFVCAPPAGGGARQILMNVNDTPTLPYPLIERSWIP